MYDKRKNVDCIDPLYFGYLIQALAYSPPTDLSYTDHIQKLNDKITQQPSEVVEKMAQPLLISPKFNESVKNAAYALNFTVDESSRQYLGMKLELKINDKEIILYDQEQYVYMTDGYNSCTGNNDVLNYYKMRTGILLDGNVPLIEIYRGDWEQLSQTSQESLLKILIENQ